MSTETPTIIDEKQNFEELRAKKQEIDKLIPEIEKKNDICYQLYENIQYEKTKLTNYQNEINTRNNRLDELKSEYNTIIGKGIRKKIRSHFRDRHWRHTRRWKATRRPFPRRHLCDR